MTFTDIGMPAGQTRDGTWNVNNWTERAFLVFDTIFLDNRRNKRCVLPLGYHYQMSTGVQSGYRIDRLAAIILNEFFPFYQHWSTSPRRPSQDLLELNARAHQFWANGLVSQLGPQQFRIVEPP